MKKDKETEAMELCLSYYSLIKRISSINSFIMENDIYTSLYGLDTMRGKLHDKVLKALDLEARDIIDITNNALNYEDEVAFYDAIMKVSDRKKRLKKCVD